MANLVVGLALGGALLAQAASPALPATSADVGAWDAAIVRRAAPRRPAAGAWGRAAAGS